VCSPPSGTHKSLTFLNFEPHYAARQIEHGSF
jgi:hypothetical protein